MEISPNDYAHIKGWGVDADPQDKPNYPFKKYTGDDHQRLNYERPPQQPINVEVLHSNERPNVTAVYGATLPPSGLSGQIRRLAFRKSESEYGHWLPLLLADRVNVIEGIINDIRKGKFPNIFAEKGMKADWKYNKKGLLEQAMIITAIATAFVVAFNRSKKKKRLKA
jgi:hypothetical protein